MPSTNHTAYYSRLSAICHNIEDLRLYVAHANQLAPAGHPQVHALEGLLVDLAAIHGRATIIRDLAREMAVEKGELA